MHAMNWIVTFRFLTHFGSTLLIFACIFLIMSFCMLEWCVHVIWYFSLVINNTTNHMPTLFFNISIGVWWRDCPHFLHSSLWMRILTHKGLKFSFFLDSSGGGWVVIILDDDVIKKVIKDLLASLWVSKLDWKTYLKIMSKFWKNSHLPKQGYESNSRLICMQRMKIKSRNRLM